MIKKIRRTLHYHRHLRSDHPHLSGEIINDQDLLQEAQRLHARVYLESGYIDEAQIGPDDRIAAKYDPSRRHSDYFAVSETDPDSGHTQVVATARQIYHATSKGHASFPTLTHLDLYAGARKKLEKLDPNLCVEISALAKRRGYSSIAALLLYRAMWQHSVIKGHHTWIMATDAGVYERLKELFGNAFVVIGKKQHYMGSDVVPAILEIENFLDTTIAATNSLNPVTRHTKTLMLKFFFRGLPNDYLKPHHAKALGISNKPSFKTAVAAAQLTIYAYVVIRFVLAYGTFQPYGVNPWIFLLIDLVTAAPYAYAWPNLIVSLATRQYVKAVKWACVVSASFAAPYAYIAVVARNLPAELQLGMSAFVVCLLLLALLRLQSNLRSATVK